MTTHSFSHHNASLLCDVTNTSLANFNRYDQDMYSRNSAFCFTIRLFIDLSLSLCLVHLCVHACLPACSPGNRSEHVDRCRQDTVHRLETQTEMKKSRQDDNKSSRAQNTKIRRRRKKQEKALPRGGTGMFSTAEASDAILLLP